MPSFADILHSKQFTFLIGANETPVTVHSVAIAALSQPLERLANGNFKEAEERVARFPYITVEDFDNICEVAYGHDLPAPSVSLINRSTLDIKEDFWVLSRRIAATSSTFQRNNKLTAHVLCASIGDINELAKDAKHKIDPKVTYENTIEDYYCCNLLDKPAYATYRSGWGEEQNATLEEIDQIERSTRSTEGTSVWNQDVSSVLLGYARIYVFAEEFLIAKLQRQIEAALRKFLACLDVFRPTRPSIIELIQYVYNEDHVPDRDDGDAMHPLREMVVHFIALHQVAFRDYRPHRELLRGGGDYPLDLQDVIAEWLL